MKNVKNNTNYYLEDIDHDNSEQAREFYAEFWGETLSSDPDDYQGNPYSGECIISANTILGCFIRCVPEIFVEGLDLSRHDIYERLKLIMDSPAVTDEEKERFEEWTSIWNSRANIMPLLSGNEETGTRSLNMAKGSASGDFHDFPDLFYSELLKGTAGSLAWAFSNGDNPEYFKKFGDISQGALTDAWKEAYVEKNYLQDLFSDSQNKYFKQIGPSAELRLPYGSNDAAEMTEEEKQKAREYIVKTFLPAAADFLKNRAKRLAASKQ